MPSSGRSLKEYQKKRNFRVTSEPRGKSVSKGSSRFVVQRHDASHLHYDFRLAVAGVLKSWALPKGLPKTSREKRLAVQTEDHPLSYANFEGEIPEGEYGAGTVKIWDKGTYQNLKEASLKSCLKKGVVEVLLEGKRYRGPYALVHFKGKNWLMIKVKKKK